MREEPNAPVLLDIDESIARLTLNRPSRLNGIDGAMQVALRGALDRIEGNPQIHALILTGAGRAFCAGQDLGERAAMLAEGDVDLHASPDENYDPLIRRLAALPCPIIAAVNGMAAGAGAALAIGCDIVLAARSARFQFAFTKLGLGPDSGTSWLLPRLRGPGPRDGPRAHGGTGRCHESGTDRPCLETRRGGRTDANGHAHRTSLCLKRSASAYRGSTVIACIMDAVVGRGTRHRARCATIAWPLARVSRGGRRFHVQAFARLPIDTNGGELGGLAMLAE